MCLICMLRWYSNSMMKITRENVLITSGSQQALDLLGRVFLDAGDTVCVENPNTVSLRKNDAVSCNRLWGGEKHVSIGLLQLSTRCHSNWDPKAG